MTKSMKYYREFSARMSAPEVLRNAPLCLGVDGCYAGAGRGRGGAGNTGILLDDARAVRRDRGAHDGGRSPGTIPCIRAIIYSII